MEKVNAVNTKVAVTSKFKILNIGDQQECSAVKKPAAKYNEHDFQEDFRKHLGLLLMGTRIPIDVVNDWTTVGRFAAASIQKDNKPRRYIFHYGKQHLPGTIISGCSYNNKGVMDQVRKRLSEENWISDHVIEMPIKAKLSSQYYNCDQYIQGIVSDSLDAEEKRLFQFIYHLHKEYVKGKKDSR